jgi:hypothetical protein
MRPDEIKEDADAAIDRAVREMMSAEPRADFGRRVRARLERPALRHSSGQGRVVFTMPRIAAVAALSAAVALFVLTRDNRPAVPTPRVAVHTEPTTPAVSPTAVAPQPTPQSQPQGAVRTQAPQAARVTVDRVPDRPVQAASIDLAEAPEPATDVEPLKAIAPITVSTMTQEPISNPEIHISPLDLSPIEIAPLIRPRRVACEENAC